MRAVAGIREMQRQVRSWRKEGQEIGLVPTMGCLHDGHLSLIRLARQRADRVIVSIFVNPTQFGPGEDLAGYPRDLERDATLCREAGTDVVFTPTAEEMYPPGYSTWVTEESLSQPLCGESRPGHFRGVTTVVSKLFNACLPDFAVFGQKDAQQALVLQRMARDLNFPVDIVVAPIVREDDGLAMSSRNSYLTAEQRERALAIHNGLRQAEQSWQTGERDAEALSELVVQSIEAAGGRVDYVDVRDRDTLASLTTVEGPALIAVAAWFGKARLLDNLLLDS